MARDGWTQVASLLRADEAELVRGLLDSAGIPVLVEDASLMALNPLLQSAVGGAKVLVQEADAVRAASVISASGVFSGGPGETVEIPEEEWSAAAPPTAADEPAREADGGERAAGHAFRAAFVGLALAATIVVPLYALSVSLRAARSPGPRAPRARRRVRWALVVSALALAFGLVLWATPVLPGLPPVEGTERPGRLPPAQQQPARP